MTTYAIHTLDTAPDAARQSLALLQEEFGLLPNVAATMANSPPLLNSFVAAFGQFHGGTLTAGERQVLLLPIVPVRYARDGRPFEFFSTVTTLGTPQDVTLQELRIECFYPADDATREQARALARRHSLMAGGRSRRTM